eukprot:TRINITY_DN102068_c0_g1_i1.p1 TRINITY_DN102068_c0_g1~~TRINITY_DN102068_c0_g1_i1.p1  ORF type:complete len:149 (-),score=10.29 TRINITY_DN102068_c0_g1_i1:287-733(-)
MEGEAHVQVSEAEAELKTMLGTHTFTPEQFQVAKQSANLVGMGAWRMAVGHHYQFFEFKVGQKVCCRDRRSGADGYFEEHHGMVMSTNPMKVHCPSWADKRTWDEVRPQGFLDAPLANVMQHAILRVVLPAFRLGTSITRCAGLSSGA